MVNVKSAPDPPVLTVYLANQMNLCLPKTKHAAIPHANLVVRRVRNNAQLVDRASYYAKEPALRNVR